MIKGLNMKYVKNDDEYDFYKNDGDKIWDVTENPISRGPVLFSFDKKKIYNFWEDYPQNLTKEEKELFDKEKPFWAAAGATTQEDYDYFMNKYNEEKIR